MDRSSFLIAYILSNVTAIGFLLISRKWPLAGRIFFSILFAVASWVNWTTSQNRPQFYLYYAEPATELYRNFILGWFSRHTSLVVGSIAVSQLLIAVGLLFKGRIYKIAVVGATIFLLAIVPLGIGSAFPCSLTMALTLVFFLYRGGEEYVWGRARGQEFDALSRRRSISIED